MLLFIILAPFIGFLINATFGRRLSKTVSGGVAVAAMLVAFGFSLASAAQIFGAPADQPRHRADGLHLDHVGRLLGALHAAPRPARRR